jgi:site-specific DNA-methyltransferase (adenine-specific)
MESAFTTQSEAGLQLPLGQVLLGDALKISISCPQNTIDLIYADPPFFTNKRQTGGVKSPDPLSFSDRWQGGLHEYLAWLNPRIGAMHALLAPHGIFLLHLDWHAVHYAKVLCDNIFGAEHFQNELIWYYQTGGAGKGRFSRKHDNILLYSRSARFHFDGPSIAIPRTPKAMKRAACPTGARIRLTDTHKNPDDVLVIPALNPMARERNGYPTQKPLALLETLIQALCPPGGTVADFFCGSGTTLVAAQRLGRQWCGCDTHPAAVKLARQRLGIDPAPASASDGQTPPRTGRSPLTGSPSAAPNMPSASYPPAHPS